MPGMCKFSDPSHYYWSYDYEYLDDYDFYDYAEKDKDGCLQSCLEKRRSVDNAVGCYLETWGRCIFIKTGTIVGASERSDASTCWRFSSG